MQGRMSLLLLVGWPTMGQRQARTQLQVPANLFYTLPPFQDLSVKIDQVPSE
jgi:hypothetical protein